MHELSAKFVFAVPVSSTTGPLVTSTALGFPRVQLPLCELLPSWSSAVLGLPLAGG